jgi:CMP-N,N'-diacetyllegionaminic acid synthase
MSELVIIPARGGSKGVPGKNMKLLNGKPLLWYSIKKASYIKERYAIPWAVSTDCPITYVYASELGGEPIEMRPPELSDSATSTACSLAYHFCYGTLSAGDISIIILQPTTPFTTAEEIDKSIDISRRNYAHILGNGFVSVRSVPQEYNAHWQYSASLYSIDTVSQFYLDEGRSMPSRRQDLPKTFYRSGSIYITSPFLLMSDRVLGPKPLALCVDEMGYHVNIDTADDWGRASDYVRHFRFIG